MLQVRHASSPGWPGIGAGDGGQGCKVVVFSVVEVGNLVGSVVGSMVEEVGSSVVVASVVEVGNVVGSVVGSMVDVGSSVVVASVVGMGDVRGSVVGSVVVVGSSVEVVGSGMLVVDSVGKPVVDSSCSGTPESSSGGIVVVASQSPESRLHSSRMSQWF